MGIEAWTVTGDFLRVTGSEYLEELQLPSRLRVREGQLLVPISDGKVHYPNAEPWSEPAANLEDVATVLKLARELGANVEVIRGCRMEGEGMTGMEFNEYFTRQPVALEPEQVNGLLSASFDTTNMFAEKVTELVGQSPVIREGARGEIR